MIEKLTSMVKNFFDYFFNNKNKTVRIISCVILGAIAIAIIALLLRFYLFTDKKLNDFDEDLEKLRAEASLEREYITNKGPDPSKEWTAKANLGKVDGKANVIVVATEEAKKRFEDIIKNGFSKSFNKKVDIGVQNLLQKQYDEADKMFDIVKQNVPDFAKRHIEDSTKPELFIDYMQKELITPETLDNYIAGTAILVDNLLMEAINEELDKQLRQIQTDSNLTFDELKKRMPTARSICESIYHKVVEAKVVGDRKGTIAAAAERIGREHNTVSIGAITAITSTFAAVVSGTGVGTAVVLSGAAVLASPIAIVGVAGCFVFAAIATIAGGVTIYSIASEAESAEHLFKFTKTMQEAVIKTRDEFKNVLETSVKDIITEYKKTSFFEGAEIQVVPDQPSMSVELAK